MEIISGEWGKAKSFPLPFVTYGATDWLSGVVLELGDVQIAKDGGAYVNVPLSQLDVVADHVIINLSLAEMKFEYAIVRVKDQTATKVFEDTGAILATSVRAWIQGLFTLIESQRGTHTAVHDQIFWDPIGGDDTHSGLLWHDAKLTYSFNSPGGVHSLLNNNEHQLVHLLPNAAGGPTSVSEYIEVDTNYTFLRGPGRDWLIEATHNERCAVLATGEGVEFSGFRVRTRPNGAQDGICTEGDFSWIHKIWVDFSRGSGIVIDNASSCIVEDFLVQDAATGGSGHAVHLLGDTSATERNIIQSGRVIDNDIGNNTDGIRVDGEFCKHNFLVGSDPMGLIIHENSGWGINEVNDANHTMVIGPRIHLQHNTLGAINLTGSNSVAENREQWATAENLATLQTTVDGLPTASASVVAYPGQFSPPFSMRGQEIEYPRKTENSIPYDLGTDLTGLTIKFMAKLDLADTDTEAAIPLKDITAGVSDLTNGLGLAPLTEDESDLSETKYYAEVQALNGAVVVQRWFFRLVIIHNVVDGA